MASISPVALTLTGATGRMPNRSPDEALADIRDSSPVALTLTGATGRMPNRSPDEALADIRDSSPVALTLTGATVAGEIRLTQVDVFAGEQPGEDKTA